MARVAAFLALGASAAALTCDVGIVGGGPGGVYSAMRLANASSLSVCVFERRARLGGRVFTLEGLGASNDLTVDIGAYRFAMERTTDNQDTTCV